MKTKIIFTLLLTFTAFETSCLIDRNRLCNAMGRIHCTYVNEAGDKVTKTFSAHDGAGFVCVARKSGKGCEKLKSTSPKVRKFCNDHMPHGCTKIHTIQTSAGGI